jgi:hypothetical protein
MDEFEPHMYCVRGARFRCDRCICGAEAGMQLACNLNFASQPRDELVASLRDWFKGRGLAGDEAIGIMVLAIAAIHARV